MLTTKQIDGNRERNPSNIRKKKKEKKKKGGTYLGEGEGGYGREARQIGIIEASRGMRRIPRRDPVGDSLGLGRPVGSGECEPVIGSTVQRIQLRKETNDGSTPTLSIAGFLMRWHRNHALFFHLNEHTTYIYYIYTHTYISLFRRNFFPLFKPFFQIKLRFNERQGSLIQPRVSKQRKKKKRKKVSFFYRAFCSLYTFHARFRETNGKFTLPSDRFDLISRIWLGLISSVGGHEIEIVEAIRRG